MGPIMDTPSVNTVEFRVGQVEIRCTGDESFVARQTQEVFRHLKTLVPGTAGDPVRAPVSVQDLLQRAQLKTFGDRAGVVAYWLQENGGRARWRSGEIVQELERIGEKIPTNITDALKHKERRGYFETKDRMWHLTPAGRSWVLYDLLGEEEDPEINTYDE
jgi:hypothetical protein